MTRPRPQIIAWEGLFDKNGMELPCTKEMKVKLMLLKDPTFRDFYIEQMKGMDKADADQEKVAEKNSLTG